MSVNPIYNMSAKNFKNAKQEDLAVEFVGTLFADVFNKMDEVKLFDNDLFPKSQSEKWFKEMINAEYSKLIAKQDLKPLTNTLVKAWSVDRK